MDDDPTDNIAYLEVPIAITSCIIYIFVGIAIHHYKETYHHMPWIHESSVVCLIGVLMGGIIKYHTGVAMAFDSNLFFYLVLPPVIFSAGYSLKRKNFFKYMDLIAFFGIFGTIANFVLIAGGAYAYGRVFSWPGCYRITWSEAMVFSAVLTGSDEVSARSLVRIKDFPRMGALIFGEGVVNDALSIVLFKTFLPMYDGENQFIPLQSQLVYPTPSTVSIIGSVSMQLVCSLLIGLCCGLLHARLMRAIPVIAGQWRVAAYATAYATSTTRSGRHTKQRVSQANPSTRGVTAAHISVSAQRQ
jgi:NhaP-type Na+/H+ or K+/H+ antiporter